MNIGISQLMGHTIIGVQKWKYDCYMRPPTDIVGESMFMKNIF